MSFEIGGRPLADRLQTELPSFVRRVLAEITERVPEYQQLPGEELAGDITRVIEQTLRAFADVLRTGVLPTGEELRFLRESAARRAEEGVPIDVVLTAYHVGIQVVWEALVPDARPEDVGQVLELNALAMRYLQVVTPVVSAGYLDERQTMSDDERSARQTLLTGLLAGTVEASGPHVVLALHVPPHPDELLSGVDASVAARRKLRRLRTELERHSREPVLSSLAVDGGLALLPGEDLRLDRIVADVTRAAGVPLTVAAVAAPPSGVAAAAELAREVLLVALRSGPGLYRLADVLLEYQLSRPSAALGPLARRRGAVGRRVGRDAGGLSPAGVSAARCLRAARASEHGGLPVAAGGRADRAGSDADRARHAAGCSPCCTARATVVPNACMPAALGCSGAAIVVGIRPSR